MNTALFDDDKPNYASTCFFCLPNSHFDWVNAGFGEHITAVTQSGLADSDPCPF